MQIFLVFFKIFEAGDYNIVSGAVDKWEIFKYDDDDEHVLLKLDSEVSLQGWI